jgi:hypothetical protein
MPYLASIALDDWTGRRRDERRVLEEAHRVVSQVTPGSGRPRQRGGDHLAQAFILRIYSEFQAFVRELHDVTASVLMRGLDVPQSSHPPLIAAATLGRGIDRGNAGLRTISDDFKRLGYGTMLADLGVFNSPAAVRDPHALPERPRAWEQRPARDPSAGPCEADVDVWARFPASAQSHRSCDGPGRVGPCNEPIPRTITMMRSR